MNLTLTVKDVNSAVTRCHTQYVTLLRARRRNHPTRMPQQYDPLSQEDDSLIRDAEPDDSDSPHAGLLPRPAVYYGEGPFNAPSSDEEDESEVAEKDGPGSLNRAEHGTLLGSELADGGLYVGGRKVCYMPSPTALAWTWP
jgi:hypothetical protein